MEPRDVSQASVLLDQQLRKYEFAPIFSQVKRVSFILCVFVLMYFLFSGRSSLLAIAKERRSLLLCS